MRRVRNDRGRPFCRALMGLGLAMALAGCEVLFPLPPVTPGLVSDTPGAAGQAASVTPAFDEAVIQTATALAMGIGATATPSPISKGIGTEGAVETATPIFIADAPTQDPNLPPGCQAVHVVAAGEWLELIARNYGVTADDIALANGLDDPEALAVGQSLCIPAEGVVIVPPGPTAAPSLTPPPGDGLAVLSFEASPRPVERGGVLRLSWTTRTTTAVRLWRMVYDSKTNQWFRPETPAYTGTGTADLTLPVPLDERQNMRFELEAQDGEGNSLSVDSGPVALACHPPFYAAAAGCLNAPTTTDGELQVFEHGAIIWRSDTGQAYVLPLRTDTYHPWTVQQPTGETVAAGQPPERLVAPEGYFAEVWAARASTDPEDATRWADVLGWAISAPQRYRVTIQVQIDARYAMFDTVFISWPDGRVAQLFTGGGLPIIGGGGPAWSFLNL